MDSHYRVRVSFDSPLCFVLCALCFVLCADSAQAKVAGLGFSKYQVPSTKYKVQSTKYKAQSTKLKVQSSFLGNELLNFQLTPVCRHRNSSTPARNQHFGTAHSPTFNHFLVRMAKY